MTWLDAPRAPSLVPVLRGWALLRGGEGPPPLRRASTPCDARAVRVPSVVLLASPGLSVQVPEAEGRGCSRVPAPSWSGAARRRWRCPHLSVLEGVVGWVFLVLARKTALFGGSSWSRTVPDGCGKKGGRCVLYPLPKGRARARRERSTPPRWGGESCPRACERSWWAAVCMPPLSSFKRGRGGARSRDERGSLILTVGGGLPAPAADAHSVCPSPYLYRRPPRPHPSVVSPRRFAFAPRRGSAGRGCGPPSVRKLL